MDPVPQIQPLRFLLGTWRGRGRGDYPTIDAFEYEEEVTFSHVGKPFLIYQQKTWDHDGRPLHAEMGYMRPVGTTGAELVLAQPSGITEIHSGTLDEQTLAFTADSVGVSPTAKEVRAVARTLKVVGDTLTYQLEMAAVGHAMQFHLEATLIRS